MINWLFFNILFVGIYAELEGCAKEISDNHCIECKNGYYLELVVESESSIPKLICKESKSIPNCTELDGPVCVRCDDGFYVDKDGTCKSCNKESTNESENIKCLHCDSTHCYECGKTTDGKQLYLSNDQTTCIDCSLAENNEACGRCGNGKYFNISSKTCQSCSDNCALCTEENNCFQCTNKTILVSDSSKYWCEPIKHCKKDYLKEDHCELCEDGYRIEKGDCVACEDENCKTCYQENNLSVCTICNENFTIHKGKCYNKTDIHCAEGTPTYGCLECESHYFFNKDLDCIECSQNCGTCVQNPSHCLSCADGYYFSQDNSECIKKDGNCSLADQAGCKECFNDLSEEGLKQPGYFVRKNEQICSQCNKYCKLCDGEEYNCSACINDYVLAKNTTSNDNDMYYCEQKPSSCKRAEMGYCTECEDGYFIYTKDNSSSQSCLKCDSSCATCTIDDSKNTTATNSSLDEVTSNVSNSICLSCAEGYYRHNESEKLCRSQSEINSTCIAGPTGCVTCNNGYWINLDDENAYNCSLCPSECKTCQYSSANQMPICTSCPSEQEYVKSGKCAPCNELEHCIACSGNKCTTCEDGYHLDSDAMACSKTNWALIIPLVIVGIILIIVIIIIIIGIVWWRRKKTAKDESKAIKPYHVSSDLELMLLGADNENFPLKTDKWELTFNLQKSKAIVDQEYEETVNLANMSKKEYYYEFHFTPSHRYELEINPKSATLKPGTAIPVTFKIKILCTCTISDNIGISAMDVDDQNKETAKFTILTESDLSLKLDHTELKPVMPPIGEGAFGMVFRGTYRGREVAIKKMKARNL
ncbi:tyrosine kinase, putative, partial [Entamoeba histolytica HM-3:IMSS]